MTTSMDDDDDIVDLTQTSDKQPVSSVCRHGIGQGVIDLCSPSPVSKKPPAVSDSHQNEDSYALIIDEDSNSSSNSASSTGLSLLSKLNLKYATAERSTSSTSLDNTRSKRSRLRSKTTEASIIDLDDSKMSEDDDVVHSTQLTAPSLLQHVLAVTSLASQANNTPTEKPVAGPTITTSAKPTGSSAAPKKQALITSFITSTAPVATSGPLTVNPEDFEVVLLIDRREKAHDAVMAGLLGEQVPCALCTLAVGDFLWVARPKANVSDESSDDMAWLRRGDELLVLDCIAERKALGDLASSLCDGRYRDQKTRIKSTQISQCFYIVEADQMVLPAQNKAISIDHIKNAMIATYVDSDMHVLRTRGMDHTVRTLAQIHRQVRRRFHVRCADGTVTLASFQRLATFQDLYGRKTATTYGALLVHQLRQIKGCSMGCAYAIARHFGTLAHLLAFLHETDHAYAVNFLANMRKIDQLEDGGDAEQQPVQEGEVLPVERDRQALAAPSGAVTDATGPRVRRKIGPAVAQTIWRVLADSY